MLIGLLGNGGPLGALVAAVIVFVLCLFAMKRFAPHWFGASPASTSTKDLDAVTTKVEALDDRMIKLERDLENRPTREEFHKLELLVTRLQEQLSAVANITTQTNHAVVRMEEYLRNAGKGKGKN